MNIGNHIIRHIRTAVLFIITISFITACTQRPKGVVSEGKMEDVLYDYHLAQGLIMNLPIDSTYKAQAIYDAVFENNGITEAEFDSSMIYYQRRIDDLKKIYTRVMDRMTEEEKALQYKIGDSEMVVFTEGGDTADIWMGQQLYALRYSDMLNKAQFQLKCDTTFHRYDKFLLKATTMFVRENKEDHNYYLDLCLSISYKNGRTVSTLQHVSNDGQVQLNLSAVDDEDLKSVSGFFYYEGKPGGRNLGFIRDITLLRMHDREKEREMAAQDSVKVDTVAVDTNVVVPQTTDRGPVLTPEEKRKQAIENSDENTNKIQIREAPEVRTPNSNGRRRRPVRR